MKMRAIGVLVGLCGVIGVAVAVDALLMQNPLAPLGSVRDAQAQQWLVHWRSWNLVALLIGIATVFSGLGVYLRKQWGFLVLLVVSLILAVTPWVFHRAGLVRFGYEEPSFWESLVFAVVAAAAAYGFALHGRANVKT